MIKSIPLNKLVQSPRNVRRHSIRQRMPSSRPASQPAVCCRTSSSGLPRRANSRSKPASAAARRCSRSPKKSCSPEITKSRASCSRRAPTHLDNHASYIEHWLKLLKEDDRAILTAAAKAEEASSLLLKLGGRVMSEQSDDPSDHAALAA